MFPDQISNKTFPVPFDLPVVGRRFKPRPLHENATRRSQPQSSQCTRRNPFARMPQSR